MLAYACLTRYMVNAYIVPSYLDLLETRRVPPNRPRSVDDSSTTTPRRQWLDRKRMAVIHPRDFGNFSEDLFRFPEDNCIPRRRRGHHPSSSPPVPVPVHVRHDDDRQQHAWRNRSSTPSPIVIPSSSTFFLHRQNNAFTSSSSESNQFQLETDIHRYNFSCVGGYSEVKVELQQIIDFARDTHKYEKYGVRLPKGILLEGPTGNGKTLIAKCVAGEAGMNFISCSGAEFMEKYVGVGASRVRELFKFAQENAPCILFIDEFDAIGRKRGSEGEVSNSERDQTLNQLLVLMDGFKDHHQQKPVMVMAATNRRDILDPASIRPGRFDKIIHVPNPDSRTRREIIEIHSTQKPIDPRMVEEIVKMTNGFNGAQIENMLNEATLYAIRTDTLPVNITHLENTRERILVGQSSIPQRNISSKALRRIATHEVGHLLMAMQSSFYDRPSKITIDSINPRQSLGYVIFESDNEESGEDDFMLREYIQDKIKVLLGGRAAEEVVYGTSVSSGAFSDLEKAFLLARTMVMNYGMGSKLVYPYMSEIYKRQIDENIHFILLHQYAEAISYIRENRPQLDSFVEVLLTKKTLLWEEIQQMYQTTTTKTSSSSRGGMRSHPTI